MIDFQIDWEDAPGVRDPVLARTWCSLTIRIGDQPITRVSDSRTKGWRNSVYGSVFPLCTWLVENLWFLLYEPYRWAVPYGSRDLARNDADRPWVHRHSFLAAREGGALPDLTLFRDGDNVLARWLRDGGDASHPFLRFVQEGNAHLPPDTVHASIEKFVETVLERVSDLSHADVVRLRDDWADLYRLTTDEMNLCAWSARLGMNAHYEDELPDSEAEQLKSAIQRIEGRIADDLLDATAIGTITQDLDWIDEAHEHAKLVRCSLVNRPSQPVKLSCLVPNGSTAYAAGYRFARVLRERLGLGADVLPELEAFLRQLGWADDPIVATETVPSTTIHSVVDYNREDVPVVAAHLPSRQTTERFVLARSLFLQACSSVPERRLVTASHTWDQRASRAFAAELLAPAEALRERIRSEDVSAPEMAQYADEFLVDVPLIERQIENHALAHVDRGRQVRRQW